MERFDIKMFTSAWALTYSASVKGMWMPNMGVWYRGAAHASENVLVEGTMINPSFMILIPTMRTSDVDTVVTIGVNRAAISSWETETVNGHRYKYPVYTHSTNSTVTITIPAHTDAEKIFEFPYRDVYQVTSVEVTGGRGWEEFVVFALASPTPRILYAFGWNTLYENLMRIKRGTWAAPPICPTCTGQGTVAGAECPQCGGFGYSGTNATGIFLDFLGRKVGLSKYDGETDEHYGKRIWSRRWEVIPTESEIRRYFEHFCHVTGDDLSIIKVEDYDEPTYFVAVDPYGMGDGALWQIGDANEDYDGMVENTAPAGVNAYFAWLLLDEDTLEFDDSFMEHYYGFGSDVYGNLLGASYFSETYWDEFGDSCSENMLDDFESYDDEDEIATENPTAWTLVGGEFEAEDE